MASSSTLDNRAATGFKNGANYDTHRPTYPPEAVEKLLTHLGIANQESARVIDLACGTGKFTELLAARAEKFEILAIEPNEGMSQELVKKNLGPRVKVLDGHAVSMLVEEGWGDCLIAAQAFHWFATEDALREIHRVLRPGAKFGMIWNLEAYNSPRQWPSTTKWEQELKDIIFTLEDGHPRFRDMKWKEVFDKQQESSPLQALKDTFTHHFPTFSLPLGEETVRWTVYMSDEAIWRRYTTLSQIANLDEERREEIRKQVFTVLKEGDTERNEKGEIALHGVTYLCWTSRV